MGAERHAGGRPRGTATLELVVVLPALFVVLFGCLELSRMWWTMNVVTQAVREGARIAVVTNPFSGTVAITRITTVLGSANLATAAAPTVTCAPQPCDPGNDSIVTASATVTFQTLFPQLLPGLAGPLPLSSTAVMRYE